MLQARTSLTREAATLWQKSLSSHPDLPRRTGGFFAQYFRMYGRVLPWRRTRNPYLVLLAEIMLQKTHSRVVPETWAEFSKRWSTPRKLSLATLRSLRSILRPLGLKKRAAWLRSLAISVTRKTGGEIPRAYEDLVALLGVGKYTANSVLCQAFGESVAMVDVNAARVYSRIYGIGFKTDRQALAFGEMAARAALHYAPAREVNLGVFDFAQALCQVDPKCPVCPLRTVCEFGKVRLASKRRTRKGVTGPTTSNGVTA